MANGDTQKQEWPWPVELDALRAAGEYHRLIFENDRVRVLQVTIGPGEFVPVHTHQWPSVVHVESSSDFVRRDGEGNVTFDSRLAAASADTSGAGSPSAPTIQWLGPLPPHSVENVGKSQIRLFTVEIKESGDRAS
jgi:hypothetical protein